MPEPIRFYFDFSSPYGYVATAWIEEVAARHGRTVDWKPILLGAIFKSTGSRPLTDVPLKGDYAKHDFARSARFYGLPYTIPEPFPFLSIAASRAFYALAEDEPDTAKRVARALYHRAFGEGGDIAAPDSVVAVAEAQGIDRNRMAAALQSPAVKDRLRAENDAAIAAGVFGSPFIIIDGEGFWGSDRRDMVDRWLETGGW